MKNMEENIGSQQLFDFGREIPVKPEVVAKFKPETVKGSQFKHHCLSSQALVQDAARHHMRS